MMERKEKIKQDEKKQLVENDLQESKNNNDDCDNSDWLKEKILEEKIEKIIDVMAISIIFASGIFHILLAILG